MSSPQFWHRTQVDKISVISPRVGPYYRHTGACWTPVFLSGSITRESSSWSCANLETNHVQSHQVCVSQCGRERQGFTRPVHRISGKDTNSETTSPLLRPSTCSAAGASRLTSPLSPQLRRLASALVPPLITSFADLLLSVVGIGSCQDVEGMKGWPHQAHWI